ncbi:MAG: RpoL/Rpb11 RNA polymerase subunit family protein [Candidatus Nanoarchaeia archaeon]
MEFKVLKEESDWLEIQFEEIDHGILNALKSALWEQKGVELASYSLDHPEIGKPILILRTAGRNAKDVWNSAIESLIKTIEQLKKEFKK